MTRQRRYNHCINVDRLVELRARQRTSNGAFTRTTLGNLGYSLAIPRLFNRCFYHIGLYYCILFLLFFYAYAHSSTVAIRDTTLRTASTTTLLSWSFLPSGRSTGNRSCGHSFSGKLPTRDSSAQDPIRGTSQGANTGSAITADGTKTQLLHLGDIHGRWSGGPQSAAVEDFVRVDAL
ncbi:hypothetical protein EDB84DRAFT_1438475 [Lactarius hengduanensis]|nr:hypothetical protein EDB84DRAFT_1438475 [Lactarius hengduanensis]